MAVLHGRPDRVLEHSTEALTTQPQPQPANSRPSSGQGSWRWSSNTFAAGSIWSTACSCRHARAAGQRSSSRSRCRRACSHISNADIGWAQSMRSNGTASPSVGSISPSAQCPRCWSERRIAAHAAAYERDAFDAIRTRLVDRCGIRGIEPQGAGRCLRASFSPVPSRRGQGVRSPLGQGIFAATITATDRHR